MPFTFGAAVIGRAAYALVFLPLLYAVTDATGSIALGGAAVAVYGATASFLSPVRAWSIDRFGARPVLALLTILFGGALAAIATASLVGSGGATLIVLAGLAGTVAPPLGPTMRVAWGALTPSSAHLRKALSLDAVTEELLYLAGPALAGIALAFIAPGLALYVPAALVTVGGLWFVATSAVGDMSHRVLATDVHAKSRSLLLDRRFVGVLLPALVAGAISGTLSVAVPASLEGNGGPAAAGVALGLFAGGSALGGLLYGALKVPGSLARQLVVLSAGLLVASSFVAVVSDAVAVSIVLAIAGLFFSPVMIVAYVAAHAAGGERQQNAATTWVNTSHNLGGAAGSATAGILIQQGGVPTAIIGTAVVAVLIIALSGILARPTTTSAKIMK
ncbi:putative MFS family arabinose efflux permease [Microbacterium halimionae]|uniref:Putative MFS family arabinose efflux permease n=1 Tax=Microbacterium halimionae TaxID=1526413 RepID=A0A7W3JPZ6_9MICO|nr:MFS transporter [Microbacterium halimionae]MBA8816826.1 putative MFS family arabinose efflux permease [Microbacterium halimionae]NII94878.1 putative MFS family arabinose efflux permease [Microbacterium halimionae]